MNRLKSRAPAKVNLTLRVLDKRTDGYHDLVSLVAFADVGDELVLAPGESLDLRLMGPNAAAMAAASENLVLKAARALAERIKGIALGRFELTKNLPVASGLGGGSADAAAALRLLAEANHLALDDPRLIAAARAAGADTPVCLESKARLVTGIGERLSAPLRLPSLPAVIVFPGEPLATAAVFEIYDEVGMESLSGNVADHPESGAIPLERHPFIAFLNTQTNDLAHSARHLMPEIATVEERLHGTEGVRLVRMSGSGSSVFAIYEETALAEKAAKEIDARHSDWWVKATTLR
ncbi:MAG TPA: 4-(cytidine 5'-diphospho)-2-C-methyl-D-erythritol kinase [Xanthobacteraceae bacterium]|nr:4-(cytidine 5'-diphospho)-2-C-methyl-D-erythritol kinase [Xanthobacteraceae bacterium]